MIESMLTTIDNPWDPFTQWDLWLSYDMALGYNTSGFLARIVITSDELSESDQRLAHEMAINEIVAENVTGIYKKVSREIPNPPGVRPWGDQRAAS